MKITTKNPDVLSKPHALTTIFRSGHLLHDSGYLFLPTAKRWKPDLSLHALEGKSRTPHVRVGGLTYSAMQTVVMKGKELLLSFQEVFNMV